MQPPKSRSAIRICLGAFAGAHGVKGETKVKTFTAAPENIAAYGPVTSEDGKRRFTLKFLRALKPGLALVTAPEIASREDAEALKGVKFYVAREALPAASEDEFYIEDLVGLAAFTEGGAPLGAVVAVHNFGAGDIVEIARAPEGDGPPAGATGAGARKRADKRGRRMGAEDAGAARTRSLMIPFTNATVPEIDLAAGTLTVAGSALDEFAAGAHAPRPRLAPPRP